MKEADIRPEDIFNKYLQLADEDIKIYFSNCERVKTGCPACGEKGENQFEKKGFIYCLCGKCGTLFVDPRPSRDTLDKYYQGASSVKYWAEHFYKDTEEARRKNIWGPKAMLVRDKINKYSSAAKWVGDIGAGYGTFCEELVKVISKDIDIFAIEPFSELSDICVSKGFKVIKSFMENIKREDVFPEAGSQGVYTCFELLEHVFDPLAFLIACKNSMLSGDLLIFTTLNGQGFDIQVLWENSKSVYPPHHMNFFNPDSIGILLSRSDFEPLEITTPGKLDVDIVLNNIDNVNSRFLKNFLSSSTEEKKNNLQKFLQNNGLSSHMMVVAKKK